MVIRTEGRLVCRRRERALGLDGGVADLRLGRLKRRLCFRLARKERLLVREDPLAVGNGRLVVRDGRLVVRDRRLVAHDERRRIGGVRVGLRDQRLQGGGRRVCRGRHVGVAAGRSGLRNPGIGLRDQRRRIRRLPLEWRVPRRSRGDRFTNRLVRRRRRRGERGGRVDSRGTDVRRRGPLRVLELALFVFRRLQVRADLFGEKVRIAAGRRRGRTLLPAERRQQTPGTALLRVGVERRGELRDRMRLHVLRAAERAQVRDEVVLLAR